MPVSFVALALLLVRVWPKEPSPIISTLTDCQALYDAGYTTSGVYTISPDGERQMNVYCEQDVDGGGWTVFQRRENGEVNFYRNWTEYKNGFGDPNVEYWLGNDNLHTLTFGRGQKLKVSMVHPDGRQAYADYSVFYIGDEAEKYRLHVTGFLNVSPPGDSLENRHNGDIFTTYDEDNDNVPANCAMKYYGGWWYDRCHISNLNGIYGNENYGEGINWSSFTGFYRSLKSVKMMVKQQN